jgi:hypothetical protein
MLNFAQLNKSINNYYIHYKLECHTNKNIGIYGIISSKESFCMQTVYMLIEAINLTTSGESQLIERVIKYLEFPLIYHFIRRAKKNM